MEKVLTFLVLFTILCGMIFIIKNPFCYNQNYWSDINIQDSHLYPNITMQMGEPREIRHVADESIADYIDLQFVWYNTDLKGIIL